ncbi:MAG TPA: PQQ-dependent dehydrogenase, methanol/ethanol family [Vicinamibacterales bacterium]
MGRSDFLKTRWTLSTAATLALVASALMLSQQGTGAQQVQTRRVDDGALRGAGANGEEWLTYGLDQGEKRFSPLTQIDATNVTRLGPAWSFDIPGGNNAPPGGGNQEATLLVSNGVLYGITTWSVVYAVDARTGKQLWKWDPEVNRTALQLKICCGVVSRGVALYEGKVIAPIIDGRLVALDGASGKPVWETRVAYPQEQYTLTMAPRVAKGKVLIGASGSEYPVRGFVDAFDANTGQKAWRFYTVPGDPKKPFENEAMRKAAPTWSGEWYKMGGGATVWDGMAYDPQANLVYFGTGNGGPWPEVLRGSQGKDNLYVCSIIAVNPDNGEMKWYYQAVPGDSWDYDSVQQLTLADMTIAGRLRRVIMQANKNGYFYVIDRLTGEFISASPYAPLNWSEAMDKKTGRPFIHPRAFYGTEPVTIFPGPLGAHNWAPMSFNPATGLVYVPSTLMSSSTYTVNPSTFVYKEGGRNTGTGRGAAAPDPDPSATPPTPFVPPMVGPSDGQRGGVLIAWDPVTQKERWRKEGGGASGGGTVTTAGNLVLQVVSDGRLIAYSADKGEKLHEINTGLRLGMGPPITYMLDGKQYVALTGGRGVVVPPPTPPGAPAAPAAPGAAAGGRGAPPVDPGPPQPPKLLVFALDAAGQ